MGSSKLAAAFLSGTLAGCATMHEPRVALIPGSRYVAMGSSYAAGPALGSPKPGTPKRCARDSANYATLLARRLQLNLVDATCSGATTAHILGPWGELPAQLDALTPATRLVTVTIGGNDVDFVRNLYVSACRSEMPGSKPCPQLTPPNEASWVRLASALREIASQVRLRSPKARLVFVDYVWFVPESGKSCAAAPFIEANIQAVRRMEDRFADLTATVAQETGAELLSASTLSKTHTPCDPEPWSVGAAGTGSGAPWHPNATGMRGIADALAAKLRSN